jgi:hypothetical protein
MAITAATTLRFVWPANVAITTPSTAAAIQSVREAVPRGRRRGDETVVPFRLGGEAGELTAQRVC